jgi:hypothetical protein
MKITFALIQNGLVDFMKIHQVSLGGCQIEAVTSNVNLLVFVIIVRTESGRIV